MLGPANYGSFDVALALADSIDQIPVCKILANPQIWAQQTIASFTAFYQLMPWNEYLVPSLTDGHDVRPEFWVCSDPKRGAIETDRLDVADPPGGTPWGEALDQAAGCFNDHITIIVGSHPFKRDPRRSAFRQGPSGNRQILQLHEGGWVGSGPACNHSRNRCLSRSVDGASPTSDGAKSCSCHSRHS